MSRIAYKNAVWPAWVALAAIWVPAARSADLEPLLKAVDPKVIVWRRDIHQHPELSNREVRTAKLVAEHLRKLGLEVQTGVARTGVVGFLRSGQPGPTIALRADMDALPVVERTDVPFRSTARSNYNGEQVGVMHACGHDAHVAVLLGVAEVLTQIRSQLQGNVLFVFQPAEEGAPQGEQGGASLMLQEGLFEKYRPEAVFGWHAWAAFNTGIIGYRSGPLMAGSQAWSAVVTGRQTHGARPWQGIDPVVTAAQIVTGLQTVVSRQVDITRNPAVLSVGIIKGGVRSNIIPDRVELSGTIRTYEEAQYQQVTQAAKRMVEQTAAANGATGEFRLEPYRNPVLNNDAALTTRTLPTLRRVAGASNVREISLITAGEDFAFFSQKVPGFYFFVGVTPQGTDVITAPSNHSPLFHLDEAALPLATRALANVAVDYLAGQ
jgi:amidohydrolase